MRKEKYTYDITMPAASVCLSVWPHYQLLNK